MTTGRINQVAIVTPPTRRKDVLKNKPFDARGPHAARADAPRRRRSDIVLGCTKTYRSSITTTEMLRRQPPLLEGRNTPHHTGLADSSTSANSNDAEAKRPRRAGRDRIEKHASGAASRRSGCRASNDAPPSDRPKAAQRVRHGLARRAVANVCTSCSDTSASSEGSRQALTWGAQ